MELFTLGDHKTAKNNHRRFFEWESEAVLVPIEHEVYIEDHDEDKIQEDIDKGIYFVDRKATPPTFKRTGRDYGAKARRTQADLKKAFANLAVTYKKMGLEYPKK